jgi:hypothetical protein
MEPADDTRIPAGYRVVAVASDTWVLIAPGGARIARYFGILERRRVARGSTSRGLGEPQVNSLRGSAAARYYI